MTKSLTSVKAMPVGSPPVGRAHDRLSRGLGLSGSGGGAGPGVLRGRRCLAAILGAAVVASASLAPAAAQAGSPPAPVAAEPAADPGKSLFRPESTVQWVGVVGFLLILLRGACRR